MADSWTQVDPQRPQRLECSSGGVIHRVITLVEKDSRLSSHRDDRGSMGSAFNACK
jgi:hypothetical protein